VGTNLLTLHNLTVVGCSNRKPVSVEVHLRLMSNAAVVSGSSGIVLKI